MINLNQKIYKIIFKSKGFDECPFYLADKEHESLVIWLKGASMDDSLTIRNTYFLKRDVMRVDVDKIYSNELHDALNQEKPPYAEDDWVPDYRRRGARQLKKVLKCTDEEAYALIGEE